MTICRIQTPAGRVLAPRLDLFDALDRGKDMPGTHLVVRNSDGAILAVTSDDPVLQMRIGARIERMEHGRPAAPTTAPAEAESGCTHDWQLVQGENHVFRCVTCDAYGWRRQHGVFSRSYPVRAYMCTAVGCKRAAKVRGGRWSTVSHWCELHAVQGAAE